MTRRDKVNGGQDAVTWDLGADKLAALAERVEADPATDNELDEHSRRVVAQMRQLRTMLREAGPARVSEGFSDRVLARFRATEAHAAVVRLRPRQRVRLLSPTVILQAASLAVLVFTYGMLLAATYVHNVNPRWANSPDPPATVHLEVVPERLLAASRTFGAASVVGRHPKSVHRKGSRHRRRARRGLVQAKSPGRGLAPQAREMG